MVYFTFKLRLFTECNQGRNSRQKLKAGVEGRNWTQELRQRTWSSAAYWTDFCAFMDLLSYTTQADQPRSGAALRGLGLPQQLLIEKMPTGQADGRSLSVEFPFSQVTSVCVE